MTPLLIPCMLSKLRALCAFRFRALTKQSGFSKLPNNGLVAFGLSYVSDRDFVNGKLAADLLCAEYRKWLSKPLRPLSPRFALAAEW